MPKFSLPCSLIKDLYANEADSIGKICSLWGHVRAIRQQAGRTFITIYDGSHVKPFQGISNEDCTKIHTGAFLILTGEIVQSPAKGQTIEMLISQVELKGPVVDSATYLPLVKSVSLDLLRGKNAYLRPKFQTYSAVYRIRDTADKIINEFMRGHHFLKLDPNILSSSDCEGAGEMFQVTNADHFFGKPVGLTVSSQLQLEALVPCAVGVYTLNKSFRAEKSSTARHLAEFTHLEWESKFVPDLTRLMDFNEDLVTTVIRRILLECDAELNVLNQFVSKGILDRLNGFVQTDFARISYTEAIDILTRDKTEILKMYPDMDDLPHWGDDLNARCERYLAEVIYKRPTFVYNYPRDLKSFYMKGNPADEQGRFTVQGCDLLMPFMGELIGSSVREENYDVIVAEMKRRGLTGLDWYIDLRKNGGCSTSGSGMGFDRLIQVLCYTESNIRDVVPFPVTYGDCSF